ncbi:putative transmembrane protein 183BP [Garra rufa]|uniref:putative transmembrane protein 183BP n=1 Tax=Garra rufa TaxID=137080 RepID=UPI003CCEDE30
MVPRKRYEERDAHASRIPNPSLGRARAREQDDLFPEGQEPSRREIRSENHTRPGQYGATNRSQTPHCNLDADLPDRLQPDSIAKMCCLRACVIRSLFHLYEPFSLRVSKNPPLPESTPTTLLNSKCLLFWVNKESGSRSEPLWEFNFKFVKLPNKSKNGCGFSLQLPKQYKDVHTNPDSGCYLLRVTTLNLIFTSVVMGMTLTLFTINVSTDMRHHRVRLEFQDSPIVRGKKLRSEQELQVVLDHVHSMRLMDWWHPQYPISSYN